MRITLNIVAALLLLMGVTWLLQGINVLPGSFMTGQTKMGSLRRHRYRSRHRPPATSEPLPKKGLSSSSFL
jgi:hypothetical protein